MASLEENKALAVRYLRAWATKDIVLFKQILAPNFVDYMMGKRRTKDELLQEASSLPTSDVEQAVDAVVAEADMVAVRYTARATHQPSGTRFQFSGMFIARIADGKLVGGWGEYDRLGILQQLGMAPSRGGRT